MRRSLLALAIVISSTLSGCVHLVLDDIGSVSIQGQFCDPRCHERSAEFRPDGTLEYGFASKRYKGGSDAFGRLPLDALIALSARPRRANVRSVSIIVGYRGRPGLFVDIPADATHDDAASAEVRAWSIDAAATARKIALGARIRAVRSAIVDGDGFGGVRLRVSSCVVTPCLSYDVTFRPDGIAEFKECVRYAKISVRLVVHSTARIPVPQVRAALEASAAQEMEPSYNCCLLRSLHAEVEITAGRATYATYGGDMDYWGPELGATVAHLNQLMLAANWKPALPIR